MDPKWLEDLISPLRSKECDLVLGHCRPSVRTLFERSVFFVTIEVLKRDNFVFLGSASIAFKRTLWEAVGGYPERLYPCEDKFFLTKVRNRKAPVFLSEGADVFWRPRSNPLSFFLQYFRYGRGDGKVRFYPERYALRLLVYGGILLLWLGRHPMPAALGVLALVGYWAALSLGGWKRIKNPLVFLILPFLFLIKDLAQLAGYPVGAAERFASRELKALSKQK